MKSLLSFYCNNLVLHRLHQEMIFYILGIVSIWASIIGGLPPVVINIREGLVKLGIIQILLFFITIPVFTTFSGHYLYAWLLESYGLWGMLPIVIPFMLAMEYAYFKMITIPPYIFTFYMLYIGFCILRDYNAGGKSHKN